MIDLVASLLLLLSPIPITSIYYNMSWKEDLRYNGGHGIRKASYFKFIGGYDVENFDMLTESSTIKFYVPMDSELASFPMALALHGFRINYIYSNEIVYLWNELFHARGNAINYAFSLCNEILSLALAKDRAQYLIDEEWSDYTGDQVTMKVYIEAILDVTTIFYKLLPSICRLVYDNEQNETIWYLKSFIENYISLDGNSSSQKCLTNSCSVTEPLYDINEFFNQLSLFSSQLSPRIKTETSSTTRLTSDEQSQFEGISIKIKHDVLLRQMIVLYLNESIGSLFAREMMTNYSSCIIWKENGDDYSCRIAENRTNENAAKVLHTKPIVEVDGFSMFDQRVLVVQTFPNTRRTYDIDTFAASRHLYITHRNITDEKILHYSIRGEYSFSEILIQCSTHCINFGNHTVKSELHEMLESKVVNTKCCKIDRNDLSDYLQTIEVTAMPVSSHTRHLVFGHDDTEHSVIGTKQLLELSLDSSLCNCSLSIRTAWGNSSDLAPCQRVLLMGLGAGKLLGYMLKRHPCAVIDTIEKHQEVVDMGREYFMLDEVVCHVDAMETMTGAARSRNDAFYSRFRSFDRSLCRSRVIVGDALDFVRTYHTDSGLDYDVVSIDVFEGIDSEWLDDIHLSHTNLFELFDIGGFQNSVYYQTIKFVTQRRGLASFYLHTDKAYDRHKTMIQSIFGESFVHSFTSCVTYTVLVASCYRNSRCSTDGVSSSPTVNYTDELLLSCKNRKKLYDRVFSYMSKIGYPASALYSNYYVISQCL